MEQIPENIPEDLAEKWLNGSITPEEQVIFDQWYEALSEEEIQVEASSREAFRELMLHHINNKNGGATNTHKKAASTLRRRWLVAAVAASVLMAIGLFRFLGNQDKNTDLSADQSLRIAQMVQPGSNKAILTLEDGQSITLDETRQGILFTKGNLSVSKVDSGLLVYKTSGSGNESGSMRDTDNKILANSKISFNTLSTPKGGKYSLVLPDGTKVWLNASSSIRYPTAFIGKERKVEIQGEAYFEVVHQEKRPFRVQVGNVLVEDIGTQFVINGYSDEPELKVSLIEGSVKVIPQHALSAAGKSKILQPGQQARVDPSGQMRVIRDADVAGELAWKNGLFNFSGSDLKSIMRQLERWYNIRVDYAPGLPSYHFGGQTYMNVSLSEVLKVLALNGIHFKIEKAENQKPVKITIEP